MITIDTYTGTIEVTKDDNSISLDEAKKLADSVSCIISIGTIFYHGILYYRNPYGNNWLIE